ncbi:MAG: hypothetical protein H6708_03205 [Kofleriaceae bacterium]|nr:hypothetical protein [Kofleriaceae bacterium]
MSRVSLALAILLASSVAANVYLLVRTPRRGTPPTSPSTAVTGRPAAAAPASPTAAAAPATARARPPIAASTDPATCPQQLAALSDRLGEVEAKLADRLSNEERFDLASSSPDAEARVADYFAAAFRDAPASVTYDVECHGTVCRLEVVQPERGVDFDWHERLRGEGGLALFRGTSMHSPEPGQDPVSKEPLLTFRSYYRLAGEQDVSGIAVLQDLYGRFLAADATAACKAAHPQPGYLSLRLQLDPAGPDINVLVGGTLATAPGGQCLRAALDAAIDATTIPAHAMGAVLYQTLELP